MSKNLRGYSQIVHRARPKLYATYKKAINATSTLETILGVALPANVCMVRVMNESAAVVRFQNNAAADANAAGLAAVGATNDSAEREFWGNKTELDLLQFYTGGANNASIEVYTY